MQLFIFKIPEEKIRCEFIFDEKIKDDEITLNKLKDLLTSEYYFYSDVQIIIATIDNKTENYDTADLEYFMIKKYNYHVKELDKILGKYSLKEIDDSEDIEEDFLYHVRIIKKIRSICRINQISLAKEQYEDAMFHRLPNSLFQ